MEINLSTPCYSISGIDAIESRGGDASRVTCTFTRWIAAIYTVDTNTNVFPSVHVVGSVAAAWAVWECRSLRKHTSLCWAVTLLAGLICLSTLFIKQHSVLDVVSGLVLSLLAAIPIYLIPWIRAKKLP